MKNSYFLFLSIILTLACSIGENKSSKSNNKAVFKGAWIHNETTDEVEKLLIVADGYLTRTTYRIDTPRFINTTVSLWKWTEDDQLREMIEFNANDSSLMGKEVLHSGKISNGQIALNDGTWQRIDAEKSDLDGAWLITGRMRNGEISRRTPGERKTMKILGGGRFQWVAYHTGTGSFSGSGGGHYTAEQDTYTEHIDFFSRDSTRVGAKLEFQYKLDSGEWHHSGLSSRGDSIYEIWTPRHWME